MVARIIRPPQIFTFSREELQASRRNGYRYAKDDLDIGPDVQAVEHVIRIAVATRKILCKERQRALDEYGVDQARNPEKIECCVIL